MLGKKTVLSSQHVGGKKFRHGIHESNYERPLEFESGASLTYIVYSPLQKKINCPAIICVVSVY